MRQNGGISRVITQIWQTVYWISTALRWSEVLTNGKLDSERQWKWDSYLFPAQNETERKTFIAGEYQTYSELFPGEVT